MTPVDLAMTLGQIDPAMPWVKSNAVAALVASYTNDDEAMTKIDSALRTLTTNHPSGSARCPGSTIYRQISFLK